MNERHSTAARAQQMPRSPQWDSYARDIAASLASRCPGWVIIWSAWRRAFTAFSAVTTESVVLDDTSAHRLLQRIGDVESAAHVGSRAAGIRLHP